MFAGSSSTSGGSVGSSVEPVLNGLYSNLRRSNCRCRYAYAGPNLNFAGRPDQTSVNGSAVLKGIEKSSAESVSRSSRFEKYRRPEFPFENDWNVGGMPGMP